METKMIIEIVVACEALAIILLLLGFVIWFVRKHPEETVPIWPMVTGPIVAVANAVVQAAL